MESRFAVREEIPALRELWGACFPDDTPADIGRFFADVFRPEECLVRCDAGRPVSMVFLLPAVWRQGAAGVPAQYIYAAGTLPACRGQGLFGALLRDAQAVGRARGAAVSFLRPGEESLFAYYARFGYAAAFPVQESCRAAGDGGASANGAAAWQPFAGDYAALREEALADAPGAHIAWDARLAGYAADSARARGGGVFLCRSGARPQCALCEPDGETLLVKELLTGDGGEAGFCHAMQARFPQIRHLRIRRPAAAGTGTAFGMMMRLRPGELPGGAGAPYMGLALD